MVFEINNTARASNLSEPKLSQSIKQNVIPDPDSSIPKGSDFPSIEMKIHLQKAERKDSNSHNMDVLSPKNQDPQLEENSNDLLLTNLEPPSQPKPAMKTPVQSEILSASYNKKRSSLEANENNDFSALNNKLFGFCRKSEHILYKLEE